MYGSTIFIIFHGSDEENMEILQENLKNHRLRKPGGGLGSLLPSRQSISHSVSCLVLPNKFYRETRTAKLNQKAQFLNKCSGEDYTSHTGCGGSKTSFDIYFQKLPNLLTTCRKVRKYSCPDECRKKSHTNRARNVDCCERENQYSQYSSSAQENDCRPIKSSKRRRKRSRGLKSEDSVYFDEGQNSYYDPEPRDYGHEWRERNRHEGHEGRERMHDGRARWHEERKCGYEEHKHGYDDRERGRRSEVRYNNSRTRYPCECDDGRPIIEKPLWPDRQALICKFEKYRKRSRCCKQKPIVYNCDGCYGCSDTDTSYFGSDQDSVSGTRICHRLDRHASGSCNAAPVKRHSAKRKLFKNSSCNIPKPIRWHKITRFSDADDDDVEPHDFTLELLGGNDIPCKYKNLDQQLFSESTNENPIKAQRSAHQRVAVGSTKMESRDRLSAKQNFDEEECHERSSCLQEPMNEEVEEFNRRLSKENCLVKAMKYLPQITHRNAYAGYSKNSYDGRSRPHSKKSFKQKLSGFFMNTKKYADSELARRQNDDRQCAERASEHEQQLRRRASRYLKKFRKSVSCLVVNKNSLLPPNRSKKVIFSAAPASTERRLIGRGKQLTYPTVFRNRYPVGVVDDDDTKLDTNYRAVKVNSYDILESGSTKETSAPSRDVGGSNASFAVGTAEQASNGSSCSTGGYNASLESQSSWQNDYFSQDFMTTPFSYSCPNHSNESCAGQNVRGIFSPQLLEELKKELLENLRLKDNNSIINGLRRVAMPINYTENQNINNWQYPIQIRSSSFYATAYKINSIVYNMMDAGGDYSEKDSSVRVAVRIRPQNSRELIDMCRICTTVTPGEPQIILGSDKAFTFDYVYDVNSNQSDIYAECVKCLIEGALHGYNATVLAYGQTGSGKTYTMGTGFDHSLSDHQTGIIPRAVEHLFSGITNLESQNNNEVTELSTNLNKTEFSVAVQFIELYNEEIVDLLDPFSRGTSFKIHENECGQISVAGATIKPINGPQEALKYLQQGALARTTASTKMNDQSSRSHALFTILIRRERVILSESICAENDLETLTSKFHFVDLAGSERLKRTMATGDRAREGISINCGLLSLGNCISALGDKSKRATHVPYRDSKLTRLLQDSLGGNSQTLMIACVSPSDRDFMETLNTLKYANRARNIKNKVQINQDQSSRTISSLRREIAALQLELLEYKQGKRLVDSDGNATLSDTFHENAMLTSENKRLLQRIKSMQETINALTERNTKLKLEKEIHGWHMPEDMDASVTEIISGYLGEIEKLQAKLIESEEMYQQLKKSAPTGNISHRAIKQQMSCDNPEELINIAKRGLEKERDLLMSRSLPGDTTVANEASDSEESDTESDDKTNEMQADLNEINSDIEIKTKLIEQLELSQQRMQIMRQQYEDKLNVLNCKISNTQKERDDVLANMGSSNSNQPKEKIKKIKDEYERKINEMKRELKRLQQAQREHGRQQRELKAQEIKLHNLKQELNSLKSIKTKLIRKMSEQTNRHKEEETRKTREIAQLRKEQRRQQNAVISLQAKMNAKEQILRRKTEEVTALRQSQRGSLSLKAAGRVELKGDKNGLFNPRRGRQRWDILSRTISHAARNKQLITQLEKELERLMQERRDLSHELASVSKQQTNRKSADEASEEDTVRANLTYLQESISHVQQAIMEFEEGKDSTYNDSQNVQNVIDNVHSIEEAKYLLQRLTENAIMVNCNSALTESRLQEHEALLNEAQQESAIQQQLLQHFLSQNSNVQIGDLFDSLNLGEGGKLNRYGSQKSLQSNGTYDILPDDALINPNVIETHIRSRSPSPAITIDSLYETNSKIRRRTAQRQDLLFGETRANKNDDSMTRSFTQHDVITRNIIPLTRVPSAPDSFKHSPLSTKKMDSDPSSALQSPRTSRKVYKTKPSHGFNQDASRTEQLQSPVALRRGISREDANNVNGSDVFSRLGAAMQGPYLGGSIQKVAAKSRSGVPLHCTHIVCGHNKPALSIKVEENILYTASADRTVKVWDLTQETAQHCLAAHPGPVVAVQYDRRTQLLYSASGPYVRVWDLRTSDTKPIKTLSSSGQLLSGNAHITSTALGESPITAMCIGELGSLYIAASDKVRIWEQNRFACTGKLSGGHQAAVMCITSWKGTENNVADFVATGSKDHYVKVFNVPPSGGIVYPMLNLEPPHYDGVQALTVYRDCFGTKTELFSASRDSGIKRWDLQNGELKQSINNTHKGWISGMTIVGEVLLTSCRSGVIRTWNANTWDALAEMKTDLMINDTVSSGQQVFTASGDGKVRIWRFNNNLQRECSLDGS